MEAKKEKIFNLVRGIESGDGVTFAQLFKESGITENELKKILGDLEVDGLIDALALE